MHNSIRGLLLGAGILAIASCRGPGGTAGSAGAGGTEPTRLGSPDAPVVVVEFSDFGCPYCARFARNTFPTLHAQYIQPGRVRWRYVPVVMGFPGGDIMGAAAVCAGSLHGADAFWKAHDLFYERQGQVRSAEARPRVLDWMAELGMDRAAMDRCMASPETVARLQANNAEASAWLVQGTPTFVINGVPMTGAHPTAFFQRILDTALDPSSM